MASAARPMARTVAWCVLALGIVALNAILAYVNLRRLEGLPHHAAVERSMLFDRAVALQVSGGVCSAALLAFVIERVLRERSVRDRLRSLAAQHRTALANVADAVIGVNAAGHVTFLNATALRQTHLTDEEAIGQPVARILPLVDPRTGMAADDPTLLAMHERRTVVASSQSTPPGSKDSPPTATVVSPIIDEGGSVTGAVIVVRDDAAPSRHDGAAAEQLRQLAAVTTRVTAAADVRSVLEVLTAGARDAVGADLAVTHVLVGGADGLDLSAQAGAGARVPSTADAPSWRDAPAGAMTHTVSMTGAELSADPAWRSFLQGIGYQEMPAGWLGAPLVALDGRALGTMHLVGREIGFSEGHAAIVACLARLAAGAIENAWLHDELHECERRKDEFLATLAHELRNPLAPMRSAIEIIKRSERGTSPSQVTAVLERQMKQMVRLIDDLLDISRITTGKLDLRLDRVDLGAVIRDAAEASRPAIEAGGQRLVLALPLEPVILQGDYARLSQVFVNLLNNAAKYSRSGGVIEVSLDTSPLDAIVRVSDSGIGIAAELLPRVFDMFVQEDQTFERARGGLGVGLTLVRAIVERHGGRVAAASGGIDEGSSFTVRLPRVSGRDAMVSDRSDKAVDTTVWPRRVLVVDDNADAADSLAALLELEGHEVRVARDGPAAVAAAREFLPDVALLDIGLPGMSGYDVARVLRSEPTTSRCLLIALTGWGQDGDRQRSQDAGFDHHLVKPLELDLLNDVLRQAEKR